MSTAVLPIAAGVTAHTHAGPDLSFLLLAAWLPILVVVLLSKQNRRRRDAEVASAAGDEGVLASQTTGTDWLQATAVASICSALPHLVVTQHHFHEWFWYGMFFLVATLAQFGFAGCVLFRPNRTVVRVSSTCSVFVIALWLFTRTVEVPIGPGRGETEPFGLIDGICAIAEACTAVFGLIALRTSSAATPSARGTHRVVVPMRASA
jgi:hypothetical protein